MRKLILSITLIIACNLIILGQNSQSGTTYKAPKEENNNLEWIQHFDPEAPIGGYGAVNGSEFSAATMFNTKFLEPHIGKEIKAVALALRYDWDNVTLMVKKGNDIKTAEVISSMPINHLTMGWNYIKLDTPVVIDGSESIAIEYSGISYNPAAGMDVNNRNIEKGCSYISNSGNYTDMADIYQGHIMIRALVGGDVSELADCLMLDEVNGVPGYCPENSSFNAEVAMSNNSFSEISDITIQYTINGKEYTENVKPEPALQPFSKFSHTIKIDVAEENLNISFCIPKVNGKENMMNKTLEFEVKTYNPSSLGERIILLEKFTGQDCSICPSGEKYIQSAITGQEKLVARIDHHYGYMDDIFTIEESRQTGKFFGVKGAPQCMVNRKKLNGTNIKETVLHPALLTQDLIFEELQKPADVTVNIETVYDAATRKLSATVKGEGKTDLEGKRINVVLTQSGYVAYQNEGGEDYVHNDFPIEYLTEYDGDALSVNSDGTYEMTFKCQIPEAYTNEKGTREVDLEQLKVVAFISDWNDCNSSEVMNTAVVKVETKGNVDITPATTPSFTVRDGRVVAEAECQSLRVYSLNGMEVENDRLPAGIYIVKAICNGDTYTGKVAVR